MPHKVRDVLKTHFLLTFFASKWSLIFMLTPLPAVLHPLCLASF